MSKLSNKLLTLILLIIALGSLAGAQGLPLAKPESVEMSSEKLNQIDDLIEEAIRDNKMPGAVVLVGRKGKIVFRRAYGKRSLVPTSEDMTVDTIFDLASLTKPIATATSIMILMEQGKIRLNDTVGKFIPDIDDENAKQVTIEQLLTHTSGHRPDFDLGEKWSGRAGMLQALKKEKLRNPPGTKFVYSDIGFIVLGEIVRILTKSDIHQFSKINTFSPLDMKETRFFPCYRMTGDYQIDGIEPNSDDACFAIREVDHTKIAPTESIEGQQNYLGSKFEGDEKKGNGILRGQVHDPTSYRMNGVAGHAGLFSTADDLARFCQMLLNGGKLKGKPVLSSATVARMTTPIVISEWGETRGLGWDINTGFSSNRGELFPLGSFGHTGFTGTGIWIDPLSGTFVIFLSNRVHPDGKGSIVDVRAKVSTVVTSAINDITPEQVRDFEAKYSSQIVIGTQTFQANRAKVIGEAFNKLPIGSFRKEIPNLKPYPTVDPVLNGIDVLSQNNFKELDGLKIGLVTNHTGLTIDGKSTIDILNEAENVKLVSLFSPEHGIRGQLDQEKINDSIDEKTRLKIYSLYGKSRRPKPEQLKNLDAMVFDIQDIGTRFYTYISTLRFVLEEAAKANIKVIVLDRPNPINGVDFAGAVADEDKLSFVATHTLPVRHGMTIGEIALMMNAEREIGANLQIIKMKNWRRSMWFDETGQTWINPSPNMRNLTQATLYPGIGLLETTNLSVGRGTDTPFEVIGAPWIEERNLAQFLNQKNIAGVRFVPVRFTPQSSVFKDKICHGINIILTDRNQFKPVETGLEIALALRKLYPNNWAMKNYLRLLVNQESFDMVRINSDSKQILDKWEKPLENFSTRRAKFLQY